MQVLPFHEFCPKVLKLNLTPGQSVLAKVAFGDFDPEELEGEERELARELFGGLNCVTPAARKLVAMRLGRGSGKTTICAAFGVYRAVTADCSRLGPGASAYFIIVAPDKPLAKLSISMAREMMRSTSALERMIVGDTKEEIVIRRPDGRTCYIKAFAAAKAGTNLRGKDILGWIGDEAEFFTSNSDGEADYAVDDKEIFRSMAPRMMPDSKGMLISTPWPVETYMSKVFEDNWQKCITAIAIKAPTLSVRGDDPYISEMIEAELLKDPENARRELFCELDGFVGGQFFDVNSLNAALVEKAVYNPAWPVAIGCDLGFTRDSSAIVVVQFDGQNYVLVHAEEMRPKPGKPLKPSEVISQISKVAKFYKAEGVVADSYYREALRESLTESGLVVFEAPEGTRGKAEVFHRTRAVLHDGRVRMESNAINKRLIQQAKLVSSKPAPGGTTTIRVPRKIGMGHGDIVSAWVLAVHKLAYSELPTHVVVHEPGTPEWISISQARMERAFQKQQEDYLKKLEKETMRGMDKGKLRQVFGIRSRR